MDDAFPQQTAMEVKGLSVDIEGHRVIDTLNFTVPLGSTTAIIGPNGAGKTVLLRALLRLLPKTQGQVKIFGVDHEHYHKVAPLLSYIPQRIELDTGFPLTVEGMFALKSPRPIGMNDVERQRMNELLAKVAMINHKDKQLHTLSGGQLQRVLIAYSLMDHPKLLIMDEPSAGIDVQGQETIYELLKRIQQEEHITMILVSHELDIVMQYAQQVLCLNKQLLCAGAPRKVLTNEILERMYGTPMGHVMHDHRT